MYYNSNKIKYCCEKSKCQTENQEISKLQKFKENENRMFVSHSFLEFEAHSMNQCWEKDLENYLVKTWELI